MTAKIKWYQPIYGGVAPGPNHKSTGYYVIFDHKVIKVVTKLTLGQHPIFFSKLSISLPAAATKEAFRWSAHVKACNALTRASHYVDALVTGNIVEVDHLNQNTPFKWGSGDKIEMYTLFIYE